MKKMEQVMLPAPEYEAATQRFVSEAVEALMQAKSPIYAQIPWESVEQVPDTQLVLEDGQVIENPSTLVSADFLLNVREIVAGNFDSIYVALDQIAEQSLATLMPALFEHIGQVAEAVGNTVDANGRELSWDLVLDLIEKIQMTFDENGQPNKITMAAGPGLYERLQALQRPTPEQVRRHEEIIARKREEFRAQRRRRALPRHGD
jgi:hypothetical protein